MLYEVITILAHLPKGLDEPVVEKGSTLSAGERQLISFARALAFDPAILILDEATANIDTETEALIQDVITSYSIHYTKLYEELDTPSFSLQSGNCRDIDFNP